MRDPNYTEERHFKTWDSFTDDEKRSMDLTGTRIGSLSVVGQVESVNGHDKWAVDCLCGSHKIKDGMNLRSGQTQSCGHDCPFRRRGGRRRRKT